jgi:hypothetical protein
MSQIGGINPITSPLQDALNEARLHGHGAGGKRSRQPQASETAEVTKEAEVRPRTFPQIAREAAQANSAEDTHEAREDRAGAGPDQERQPNEQGGQEPQQEAQEHDAEAVLAEWLAMNPHAAA